MNDYLINEVNKFKKKIKNAMTVWIAFSFFIAPIMFLSLLFDSFFAFIFVAVIYFIPFVFMKLLYNDFNKYLDNNIFHIVSIILSFCTYQIITGIMLLMAFFDKRTLIKELKQHEIDDINDAFPEVKKEKTIEKISPEAKRIDLLMKVGVFFVVLAGFLFATSISDSVFLDKIKPFFLLVLSFMFYGLSLFFNQKVVIKKSEKTYYILFHLFLILFFVSLGVYNTFGDWFSFTGDGCEFFVAIVLAVSSVSFRFIGNKFELGIIKKVSYFSMYLSILSLLIFTGMGASAVFFSLLLVSLIIFYIVSNDYNNFLPVRGVLLVITFIYLIINLFLDLSVNEYFVNFCNFALLFLNCLSICKIDNNKGISLAFGSCVIYLETFLGTILNNLVDNEFVLQLYFFALIVVYVGLYYINCKSDKEYGLYNLSLITMTLINSVLVTNFTNPILGLLGNLFVFGFIFITILKNNNFKFKGILLIFQFIYLLSSLVMVRITLDYFFNLIFDDYYFILLYLCFIAFLNYLEDVFLKKLELDVIFYVGIVCLLGIASVMSLIDVSIIFNLLILLGIIAYRFYFDKIEKDNVFLNYFIFIVGLTHFSNLTLTYLFNYAHIIVFISMLICAFFFRKNKRFLAIALILSFVPYSHFLGSLDLITELNIIMIVIPSIVLIHLFTKCILDCDKKIKFFIELFGMLLLFALYSFEINVVAAIFNLVIGILFIFIGNKNEDYLSLFYDGIILLILDVIVQFSEYWLKIPFYVYIFLLGILLVGYATYRELNKNKAKVVKKVEDKKIVYLEKKEYNVQYNILGVVTIISLAILFSLYSSLEYNSKVTYEINHFYENLDKYIKERNLDSNKYLFVYSNHYAGVYIEENNTLDPYDFMDYFDIDMVEFYWCSKDSMEYNFKVHKNNKRYDRWYDDYWYDKSASFSKSDDKVSKLFYLNSYSVEIKSDINDFNFYRTGGKYSEELNLEYNQYETNRLDVCVNSYSDVYVYSIGQVFNYLSEPDKKCYYVTGNNSVNFRVIAFNDSINNNYNQYDNQGDYEY